MEFLKEVLDDEELYQQVAKKIKKRNDIKLANLATGEYVGKGKYQALENKVRELSKQLAHKDAKLHAFENKVKDLILALYIMD